MPLYDWMSASNINVAMWRASTRHIVFGMPMNTTSWQVGDLVVVGVFTALIKASTMIVTFAGGGMNPLALLLKNCLFTTLLIVLLYKVSKFGVILLFTLVSAIVSLLLMGSGITLMPAILLAGLVAEGLVFLCGGYTKPLALLLGVAVYDLLSKGFALGLSWLVMREQPELLLTVSFMIAIGYVGSLVGLGGGMAFVRELRHAGIIHN